ncbi:haloacid dehalogenase [bacterium]|nr:haloacid dehalogenase [bacterium]
MDKLYAIAKDISQKFQQADSARERSLPMSRQAIRECSLAIRAVHRSEKETAQEHLRRAADLLRQINETLKDNPEVMYAGFYQDAQKEFAEGNLTYALTFNEPIPTPQELSIDEAAYINGLAEAVGELRRHALDLMRSDNFRESEKTLDKMDEIFSILTLIDFPDALTRGLRRSTDIARGCLEKTRGDLTAHHVNEHLRLDIAELQKTLKEQKL